MLDEHVPPVVARELRRRGLSCFTIQEAGRRGLSDDDQLRLASEEGLAFVSYDADFSELARSDMSHAGIIMCKPRTREVGSMVRALVAFAETFSAEDIVGQLWYV
jgi:predicted nuclease of predicted toxin-antitoxin system